MQKSKSSPRSRRGSLRRVFQHGDRPWQGVIILISVLVIILMLAIGGMLWVQSAGARTTFGWSFLAPTANPNWDPVNNHFQAWPFLYGTLLTSLFAILFALPIGLGIAIFLAELCPAWLRTPLTWMVELLAAIPSVVYGLWGIFVFLPKVVAPVGVFLGDTLGRVPVAGRPVCRPHPCQRGFPAGSQPDPDHHDHSHYCSREPGCLPGHSQFHSGKLPRRWAQPNGRPSGRC